MGDEVALLTEHENRRFATEATLISAAIGANLTKEGRENFSKILKLMTEI